MDNYIVYVLTDDEGRVLEINSSAFLPDNIPTGWTMVDEGQGDRYHHAQSNYLSSPLTDEHGRCRWKLDNGMLTLREAGELEAPCEPAPSPAEARIAALEQDTLTMMQAIAELYETMIGGI